MEWCENSTGQFFFPHLPRKSGRSPRGYTENQSIPVRETHFTRVYTAKHFTRAFRVLRKSESAREGRYRKPAGAESRHWNQVLEPSTGTKYWN